MKEVIGLLCALDQVVSFEFVGGAFNMSLVKEISNAPKSSQPYTNDSIFFVLHAILLFFFIVTAGQYQHSPTLLNQLFSWDIEIAPPPTAA